MLKLIFIPFWFLVEIYFKWEIQVKSFLVRWRSWKVDVEGENLPLIECKDDNRFDVRGSLFTFIHSFSEVVNRFSGEPKEKAVESQLPPQKLSHFPRLCINFFLCSLTTLGVSRIARRSSVNTVKPPPPVRRSSSVTPSHHGDTNVSRSS